METRIAASVLLLLASACAMPGQTDPHESFWGSYYSYDKSEEQKEKDWWGGFYGTKKAEEDPSCSFYGNCKKSGAAGAAPADSGSWYGGGASSGGGADAGHDAGSGW